MKFSNFTLEVERIYMERKGERIEKNSKENNAQTEENVKIVWRKNYAKIIGILKKKKFRDNFQIA